MATFITQRFLEKIKYKGRLLEAITDYAHLTEEMIAQLPRLNGLSSWECILEEVLDTDHETAYYLRFVNELYCRGYSKENILEMRIIAWETAGWLNYEMMLWDWCSLDEKDMLLGLKNRFSAGDISKEQKNALLQKIQQYKIPN